MATVLYRRLQPPPFQAYGAPVGWWMAVGDRENFCAVSARPFQANDRVRLEAGVDAVSDNNLNQITTFTVTLLRNGGSGGGGLLRLTAAVVGP